MEVPLAEADPHPGLSWNTWKIAVLPANDTAGIGLLNVREWRFGRPRLPRVGSEVDR